MTSDDIHWQGRLLFKRSSLTIFLSLPATPAPSRRTNGRKPRILPCWDASGLRGPKVELDHIPVGDRVGIWFLIKTCPKSDEILSFAYLIRWLRGNQASETRRPAIDPEMTLPTLTGARGLEIKGHHLPVFPSPSREMLRISSIISGNICYHSVQNLLCFSLLPKNINIKVYTTAILSVVWDERETLSLTQREKHRLRRILGPERDEVTGEWTKLLNNELYDLNSSVF